MKAVPQEWGPGGAGLPPPRSFSARVEATGHLNSLTEPPSPEATAVVGLSRAGFRVKVHLSPEAWVAASSQSTVVQ